MAEISIGLYLKVRDVLRKNPYFADYERLAALFATVTELGYLRTGLGRASNRDELIESTVSMLLNEANRRVSEPPPLVGFLNILRQAAATGSQLQADLDALCNEVSAALGVSAVEQRPAVPGPEQRPVVPFPASASLTADDKDRLVEIIQRLPAFRQGGVAERVSFLNRAGLPARWINGHTWAGPPIQAAHQLLMEALKLGEPLPSQGGRPGYTALGLVLSQMVAEEVVGRDDGLYCARVIKRYRLIDLPQATVPAALQALLDQVP